MSTKTAPTPANGPQTAKPAPTFDQARKLLDQILDSPTAKSRFINDYLDARIEKIEDVLPDQLKGQGKRLAKRAVMTFNRRPELRDCPEADFIRCVVEAAELGLAIDGKLCYVVRYKNTWQCQPDYKGLIAVAKRSGIVRDVYGDVVCEHDRFEAHRDGPNSHLIHQYELGQPRGEVIGAYAVVLLPDGGWRYELMDRRELDRIQALAPSKAGPWSSHVNEMRKKTVFKRLLKLYSDDPAVALCLAMMDQEYDEESSPEIAAAANRTQEVLAKLERRTTQPAVNFFAEPETLPDPPPADTPEQLNEKDLYDDLTQQIGQCDTAADLKRWVKEMVRKERDLGEEKYKSLNQLYRQRLAELEQPARQAGDE